MKTILFASRKGGSGKTTLLAHLAVQAMHEGEDVTIVDLDPQQNLKAWWGCTGGGRTQASAIPGGSVRRPSRRRSESARLFARGHAWLRGRRDTTIT